MATQDKVLMEAPIKHIELAYHNNDGEASAMRLLYALFPDWEASPGPLKIKQFTEGIMNTLLKLTKERPEQSQSDNEKGAVLLRAYGDGSDILVDRDMEARTHTLLTQQGLAAPLLARFQNGLLYSFAPGQVCTAQDLGRESVWRAVAARLGEWHARLPIPKHEAGEGRNIWTVLKHWVAALPADAPEEKKRKSVFEEEMRILLDELARDKSKDYKNFVLGHCDLLSANVIIPTDDISQEELNHQINVIDYEFAMPCPAAFDIANHLSEWAGFECNYNILPTRSQRLSFTRQYIQSYRSHTTDSSLHTTMPTPEALLIEVDSYRGIPGLYWGLHALISAKISNIDFNWPAYAELRLGEYWAWRNEVNGTRAKEGREMPPRERR